ncbi:MAG: hypothetical protein KatS3mg118_0513 [Paracoccaceae bacterium]|nr:MAG: hypothetical protein KatS3mg118_0513 [Paracoccaceae bacterium]
MLFRTSLIRLLPLLYVLIAAGPLAAAPFAAIVMDARDGSVLHAENADARLHPASLTKMMTLYLTFEAIRDGRLKLDQMVTVSARAAREPPSRIGLREGQRVRVRDLIRAAAIKSANDAATALGEAIAGSEAAFARMMTAKARAMGMTRTTFRNAHGLTTPGHLSSARDMAILARHLMYDFPQYFNIFGRRTTPSLGKVIRNTNALLSSYDGADGIKTGYTVAAGYNLVASARRGSKRIIAVVFGGRSSRARNETVARLLDLGFRTAPARARIVRPGTGGLDPEVMVSSAPPPRAEPPAGLIERGIDAVADAVAAPVAAATAPPPPPLRATAVAQASPPPPRPDPRIAAIVPRPRPGPPAAAEWVVQLGAYRDRSFAIRALKAARNTGAPVLRDARPSVDRTVIRGVPLYQALLTGLTEERALAVCSRLRALPHPCRPQPVDAGG